MKWRVWGPIGALLLVAVGAVAYLADGTSEAAQLGARSLTLSNNNMSAQSVYSLSFVIPTAGPLGAVRVQFCANGPLPDTPCTTPAGFSGSDATLVSQDNVTGFNIAAGQPSNEIVLTRPTGPAAAGPIGFQFDHVVNPSSAGSYYVRVQTYAGSSASGPASNDGGIAFAITNMVKVSAMVPPYLTFCTGVTIGGLNCANANGDYIDFGELSPGRASSGSSQMLVATNSGSGYGITMGGTTLQSGTNEISALVNNDVSRPGTPQFGLNLRANAAPSAGRDPSGPGTGQPQPNYDKPNSYRFVSGESVVSTTQPEDARQYTASYLINVPRTQAPGIYVATITYVCLASF